jgi:hypothetical protein
VVTSMELHDQKLEELGLLPQLSLSFKPLCRFTPDGCGCLKIHLAILPPLDNSKRLLDFEFPFRREEQRSEWPLRNS